jgi:hypothetical protein
MMRGIVKNCEERYRIGIGGAVTCSPLPHHRTGGSRIRRFDKLIPHTSNVGWAFAVWGRRGGFTSRVSIRCGFTALCLPKARRSGMASAIPPSRPKHYWPFLSFGPSPLTRLLRPLLTSTVRSEHLSMSSVTIP